MADSLPVIVEIARDMLGVELSKQEVEMYRNMTAKQVLKKANIPIYRLPGLMVKGRTLLKKRTDEIELFKGLDKVIETLAAEHKLYVVSSNGVGIINEFLTRNNLLSMFAGVYGNVGIFSKAQALKKVLAREGFTADEAVYIGDEVRDIEAAKKIGMPIISVTWGYNGEKIINEFSPDYIALKPKDILKYVKELD